MIFSSVYNITHVIKQNLPSKLKSELSRNFERVMVSLCLSTSDFLAREMYEAMEGLGTNDDTLIEILCSSTNEEMREINFSYLRGII
jgi:annexin A7/11